ncbi:MAG: hypothetical protein MUF40_05395, partial [Gemmatimonadaceae bacterium]|nr:hypothetical protein [Gemmatimonadaceae bacterium]
MGSAAFACRSALLLATVAAPLLAQAGPDSAAARRRDSLVAAVLADTADTELAEALTELLVPARGGSIAVRPLVRRYRVGDVVAVEQVATTTVRLRGDRWALRGTITPVRYRAEGTTVTGTTPLDLRADLRLRAHDTLRLVVQTGSRPASLGADAAAAIGAVGTGTLDLDALALPSA